MSGRVEVDVDRRLSGRGEAEHGARQARALDLHIGQLRKLRGRQTRRLPLRHRLAERRMHAGRGQIVG